MAAKYGLNGHCSSSRETHFNKTSTYQRVHLGIGDVDIGSFLGRARRQERQALFVSTLAQWAAWSETYRLELRGTGSLFVISSSTSMDGSCDTARLHNLDRQVRLTAH
jgi:hypothetical protein